MSKRCEICSVDFIDDHSFSGHLLGKKHAKSLEFFKQKTQKEQNSVFIAPVPPFATPQLVFNFFSQFGPLQHYIFNPRYLIIEYKEKSPVDHLLSKPIHMNKWKLNIRRRKIENPNIKKRDDGKPLRKQKNSDKETTEETEAANTLKLALESVNTIDEQIDKFIELIQPDGKELHKLSGIVCSCLDKTLSVSFPKCCAVPFGSSITGLALIGSDLDIFLDIGEEINEDESKRIGWTPKTIFKEVKSLLFKNQASFVKIIPIPMAKIPVIKFHHVSTNLDCDISFKHGLGIFNSQLIKYLLTLDSRIKPLIIIIKYWAKILDLSGTGKITNYSLVMLIIFYLQQSNINILPTISELQKRIEPIYSRGWQVNFDKNYKTSGNNSSTISELLEGFFKFYFEFDFSASVICPLDGLSHSRVEFRKKIDDTGLDSEGLHLTRPACLQDPIQLDHNITSGWSTWQLQNLKCSCLQALGIYKNLKDNFMELLPTLVDPVLKNKTKKSKSICFIIPAGKYEKFGLPDDFNDDEVDEVSKQKLIEKNWFLMIFQLLEKILTNIFKFEVQIIYDAGLKQIKLKEESDVHTKDHDNIMLSCIGKYCMNRTRKGRIPTLDPSMSPIDKETIISDRILKDLAERNEEIPIKFTCHIKKKKNPLHASVILIDNQFTNKSFLEIANYMSCKIPCIIDKELTHMVQFNKKLA